RRRSRASPGQAADGARGAQQQLRVRRHQCQPDRASYRGLMPRRGCLMAALAALALLVASVWTFLGGWYGAGPLKRDTAFIVADGSSLTSVAAALEKAGAITSADGFRLRARVLGAG